MATKTERGRDPRGNDGPRTRDRRRGRQDEDGASEKLSKKAYAKEMRRLQEELVKMEDWVSAADARIVVIFEGRDAAGKGGTIKRITQYMNPRVTRIVALPKPTERERSQWYFQRYIANLPSAGEIVLFDRSWYNRAGVEKVLGFCTPEEHRRFLRQVPIFERLLVEEGIILLKYWFSVSDDEQERRFRSRIDDPMRRWKLSDTDLLSRSHWVDFSRAKDEMFVHTDIPEAPWYVVEADDKPTARLKLHRAPAVDDPVRGASPRGDPDARASERRRLRAAAARDVLLRAGPRGVTPRIARRRGLPSLPCGPWIVCTGSKRCRSPSNRPS
jgi:polyphosphate kinase 2